MFSSFAKVRKLVDLSRNTTCHDTSEQYDRGIGSPSAQHHNTKIHVVSLEENLVFYVLLNGENNNQTIPQKTK